MARIPIAPPGMKDQRPRYTLGWRVGNHIYVAGQLPFDKDGNLLGKGDIKAQTAARTSASRPGAACHRGDDVPRDGHDVLAGEGGGGDARVGMNPPQNVPKRRRRDSLSAQEGGP